MWLTCYIDSLSDTDKTKITYADSKHIFKFGDGNSYSSIKQATIPVVIGNKEVYISTDIINSDIPLLLSKQSMKRANTNLNFINDTVNILGQKLYLSVTSSGHYCLPLGRPKQIITQIQRNPKVKVTLNT